MANLFASGAMAEGYARNRPPVHAKVVELIGAALGGRIFKRALDVGCGSGLSTRALAPIAGTRVGLEPAVSMLLHAGAVAPGAVFVAASAERLPFADGSFDLVSAAGSLNYARLDLFMPEATRVLASGGLLAVYDFSAGRTFPESDALDHWFEEFMQRYPPPVGDARALSPGILAGECGPLRPGPARDFRVGIAMDPDTYVRYMLTETNVARAVSEGAPLEGIEAWCRETLAEFYGPAPREVLFDGYYALFTNA